jgi:hypothetical protein
MAGRNVMQLRPRGDTGAMPYSPQRDLATLYVPAMREALMGLDQVNWRPFFQEWMAGCNITQDDLAEGIKRFVEAHRLFTGVPSITEPVQAFERSGFNALSPAIQAAIYFRIGEVIAAGFFIAIRDVTIQGQLPPNEDEIARTVAAARKMAERLTGVLKTPTTSQEELETTIEALKVECEDRKAAMCRLHDMVHDRDRQLAIKAGELHAAVSEKEGAQWRMQRRKLWQTLKDWWSWRVHRRRTKVTSSPS